MTKRLALALVLLTGCATDTKVATGAVRQVVTRTDTMLVVFAIDGTRCTIRNDSMPAPGDSIACNWTKR